MPERVRLAHAPGDLRDVELAVVRRGQLGPQGVCLLLGLAVVVTLEANVGKAAALFLAEYDTRAVAATRAERAAAERASAA